MSKRLVGPKFSWKAGFPVDYLGVTHLWKTLPSSELLIQIIGEPCAQRQEQAPFGLAGILSPPEIPASNLDFRKRNLNCVSKLCLETDAVSAPQPLC